MTQPDFFIWQVHTLPYTGACLKRGFLISEPPGPHRKPRLRRTLARQHEKDARVLLEQLGCRHQHLQPLLLGIALASALAGRGAVVGVLRGPWQHLLEEFLRIELSLGGASGRQEHAGREQQGAGGTQAARTNGRDHNGRCSIGT